MTELHKQCVVEEIGFRGGVTSLRKVVLTLGVFAMRVSGGAACAAINCSNNRGKNPELSFFTFPKNPERRLRWIKNCRRKDFLYGENSTKYATICSSHFEQDQFMNALRNKLTWCAVPTLFDVPKSSYIWITKRKVPLILKCRKFEDTSTITDKRHHKSNQVEEKFVYTLDSSGISVMKENVKCWDISQMKDCYSVVENNTKACCDVVVVDNAAVLKCEPYYNKEEVYDLLVKEELPNGNRCIVSKGSIKQEQANPLFVNVGDNWMEADNESTVENGMDPLGVTVFQHEIKSEPDEESQAFMLLQEQVEDGDIEVKTEPYFILEPHICLKEGNT